jgi:hypothetical protein
VIDYTAEDSAAIGETFDYVLDAVGKTTYFRCRKLLGRNGVFSASDLGPFWQNIALSAWSKATRNRRFVFPVPKVDPQFTSFLGERLATGVSRSDRSIARIRLTRSRRRSAMSKLQQRPESWSSMSPPSETSSRCHSRHQLSHGVKYFLRSAAPVTTSTSGSICCGLIRSCLVNATRLNERSTVATCLRSRLPYSGRGRQSPANDSGREAIS